MRQALLRTEAARETAGIAVPRLGAITEHGRRWRAPGGGPDSCSWECVVIESDDPRYPVGGYRPCVSYAELRRGRLVELGLDHDADFSA